MTKTANKTSSRAPARGSSRTVAGVEAELAVVRQELGRVDHANARLHTDVRYAARLFALAALACACYALLLFRIAGLR